MWKVFLLLACVSGSIGIVSCNDAATKPTGETKLKEETGPAKETDTTGETNLTGEITLKGKTEPTDDTDGSSTNESRGCGGHPPICRKNEVYYNCSGGCIPRRCSEIGYPLNCDKKCTPGCVCKSGYVRADNGTCILIADCPSCGGDTNAQQGCGNNCGRTCSTYNKPPTPCPPGCIFNGCNCRKGFVYDNNVKACVKPEDCTPICRANEEYSPCTNGGCDARNCSQIGKSVPCIKLNPNACIKGCVCVKGYLRASNGTCVPKDQCTPKCDNPNEVYDVCPAPCPPKQCNVNEALIRCKAPPKPGDPDCNPGCRCADNYYRNATGTCVLKKKCEKPLTCDLPNEVYDACPPTCPAKECGVNPAVLRCMRPPEYGDPSCKPSCVCIDGYVRNDARKCIPRDKCPKPCGKNEHWEECYYSCGGNETCDDIGKKYNCPANLKCLSGCRCNKGYWRNTDGVCIPENQCLKCGPNEVFSNCTNGGCEARNCSQAGKPVPCVKLDPKSCIKGCVCQPGYLRSANGTCVPKNQCNEGCGNDPNAHPGCGVNCGRTCSTYKTKNVACILSCDLNGCDCNDGYVFDPNVNKCVLPKDCTPTCRLNEVYSSCTNGGCGHRNCSQLGQPEICIDRTPESCTKGCICASGYLRADNGTCVPQDKCPATGCGGDPNAQPGCGYNCGKTCTTYKAKHPLCPRIVCKPNGCDCKDGYVFDANVKKCVLPQDCITCGINEVYDVCPAPCPPRRCDVDDRLIRCAASPQPVCKPGCRCAGGYARNATGTCVLRKNCEQPLTCDRPNEIYDSCPPPCPGQSCDVNPALVLCAPSPQYGDPACKPACRCIDGYARNAANECIPRDKCQHPLRCDKNEVYNNCSDTGCRPYRCSELGFPLKCDKKCKPGCICKDDYVRDDNGDCILIKNCSSCGGDKNATSGCGNNCGKTCASYKMKPAICTLACRLNGCDCRDGFVYDPNVKSCVRPKDCTPTCKVHEEYSPCINGGCGPKNCSQVGQPNICVDPVTCIKGCVCVKGYLRASNGTCIPRDQCPSPQCPDNEVYDPCSSVNCPPGKACAQVCTPTCRCADGLIRCKDGRCAKPKNCQTPPPECPDNEVYDPCPPINCPPGKSCAQVCTPTCRCADGLIRCKDGRCAKPKNCQTTASECPDNEVYDPCPPINCPPGKSCAQVCTPTCRCADGLIRCKDGRCAKPKNCQTTPAECPDNEVYDPCPPINCPPGKSCAQVCTPTCRCADGLIRCKDGRCAKPKNCQTTASECPDNEVYDPCPPINCPPGKACPQVCTPTCRCADGLIRCKDGRCAKPENCQTKPPVTTPAPPTEPTDKPSYPPICKKNEVYYNCSGRCTPRRCSEIGFPLNCDEKCTPGCVCKDKYVRADNGTCIPIPDCPSCGGDKNAVQGCSNYCGHSCSTYNKSPSGCPLFCISNGCDCRKGFVYDNNVKACVKPEDCTPTCKVNEEYFPCINGGCGPKNCSQVGQPDICIDPVTCIKGCVCVKGYLRASNGTCLPKDQCPPPDCPTGENWDPCPTVKCDGDNCPKTRDSPQTCPVGIVCDKPRCVCGYNRKRDRKTGNCIPIKDCPPFKCDCNEEYQACPLSCPGERCSDLYNKMTCPPNRTGIPVKCRPACKCIKGYLRDADGKCIPASKCPIPAPEEKP